MVALPRVNVLLSIAVMQKGNVAAVILPDYQIINRSLIRGLNEK